MSIIMNEREFALEVIDRKTLGDSPIKTLYILSKYYFSVGYTKKKVASLLKEAVLRNDPKAVLQCWEDVISDVIKKSKGSTLIEVDGIFLTKKEMDICASIEAKRVQRLFFTILCLAKYENAVRRDTSGWVNTKYKDIFKLANIDLSKDRQCDLIYTLVTGGYITLSKKSSSLSFKVECLDYDGDAYLSVTDFRNLGNQYLRYIGEPYIECANCGLVVRRTGRSQKYCKSCAADVNRMKTSERNQSNKNPTK